MSEKYDSYLQTDYWQAVATAIKKRAGYRCQVCNSQHDLAAHHRTYEHRGAELEYLDDLICLCRRCHAVFHGANPDYLGVGMARAAQVETPAAPVLITKDNCHRLRCTKDPWHWMAREGLKPSKSGWRKRAIGRMVPAHYLWQ